MKNQKGKENGEHKEKYAPCVRFVSEIWIYFRENQEKDNKFHSKFLRYYVILLLRMTMRTICEQERFLYVKSKEDSVDDEGVRL